MKTLRIVNLNTWVGLLVRGALSPVPIEPPGHKELRYQALLGELRERAPDVVTLQEVLPLRRFARRLARDLGYDVVHQVVNSGVRLFGLGFPLGVGRGEGLAILAKRELGMRFLSGRRLSGVGLVNDLLALQVAPLRAAIAVTIKLGQQRVIVANTHVSYAFPSDGDFETAWASLRERGVVGEIHPRLLRRAIKHRAARDEEVVRLTMWLSELSAGLGNAPFVLGADLNLQPDHAQVRQMIETLQLRDPLGATPEVLTWDPSGNENIAFSTTFDWPDGTRKPPPLQLMALLDAIPQRPDYVLVSPHFGLADGGVAFTAPRDGAFASDHYGVWADATLDGGEGR